MSTNIKPKIKEVVIVEGKTDSAKLKSIFDVSTIETNGLALTKNKIEEIKKIANDVGVILFLDPDGPGEKIRKILIQQIPVSYNCFISKKDILNKKKKIGIAEASVESIIEAFKNIKKFDNDINTISWSDYIILDLDNKEKRLKICQYLKISYCNHKQLFKKLNMLGITLKEINEIKQTLNIV
ncbi:ribonuclease M5 [Malacoplasma iowae]|uniref:Ribonuclease M5 n=1 Tax=Malacoplasma iowae 695 TaxID=1048830 RepID=A0A9J7BWJ7_MALIO|nr:ribonuclease M5 [Malacoplasma iowae]VEU62380.1 Primase-like protein [Mycoplasmopsis fermentans]EGZ31469.1 nucleotidyltransferase [Malacoplasma iowae 695]UYS84724.1 ribonuclease M5 [Malacoplasma iowae 695]WPL35397.1 ribonuclease M5 [Malacoplasma iowae]VEU72381.1 Primase-like protein [Malacoplasma iowae]